MALFNPQLIPTGRAWPMMSRAVAVATNIPVVITTIVTNGYYDDGDGGAGIYKRVGAEPAHPGKFQSHDGAWWELTYTNNLNANMLGAKGDNVQNDEPFIDDACQVLRANGGGALNFLEGFTYRVDAPITIYRGLTYQGANRSDVGNGVRPGAKIVSDSSSIFTNDQVGDSGYCTGWNIRDLWLESEVGGGQVLDFEGAAALVAKAEISGVTMIQRNPGACVVNGAAQHVFSLWFHDFEFQYETGATAPAFLIVAETVNTIIIERFWSTYSAEANSGSPAIVLDTTNPAGPVIGCEIRSGVFELSRSGCVAIYSGVECIIENCQTYDLSVPIDGPQFSFGKNAGPAPSNNIISNIRSKLGHGAIADIYIPNNVPGAGAFTLINVQIDLLLGAVDGGAPLVTVINGAITTCTNCSYTALKSGGGNNDLEFFNNGTNGHTWAFRNGYNGGNAGHFSITRDGVHAAGFLPSGVFGIGGTVTAPNAYFTPAGELYTTLGIFPSDGDSAQGGVAVLAGAGAPSNALGQPGWWFFSDNGNIYKKGVSVWTVY